MKNPRARRYKRLARKPKVIASDLMDMPINGQDMEADARSGSKCAACNSKSSMLKKLKIYDVEVKQTFENLAEAEFHPRRSPRLSHLYQR